MLRPLFLSLVTVAALAACERPGAVSRHTVAQSLKGVLAYPRSALVSMASGDSAGQMSLASPDEPDTVANWFRNTLDLNHWTLQSDQRLSDGSILIYAERGGQPLWINLQHATGGPGTSYTLTGAIAGSADTTKTDSAQRSGSSMSSKRIQR
jgi:hypothetical protein